MSILKKIVNLGTIESNSITKNRLIITCNISIFLTITMLLIFSCIYYFIGNETLITQTFYMIPIYLLLVSTLLLNKYKKNYFASLLYILTDTLTVATLVLTGQGNFTSAHHFFLLVSIVVVVFFNVKQWKTVVSLVALNGLLFIYSDIYGAQFISNEIYNMDSKTVLILSSFFKLSIFITAFLVIWLAIYTSYQKERLLDKKNLELKKTNKQLHQLSITDNLTKLFNRNKLDEILIAEANRLNRYSTAFGIILIDVDHFKSVNDIYGHQMGDTVLKELSNILKSHTRKVDTVGRWGGEEFLIVCSESELKGILILAEHLKEKIATYPFSLGEQKTASFGISIYKKDENIESMIKRADDALYKAKENGRNKVEYIL